MRLFNRLVAALLPYAPRPLVRHLSRHYIAGEELRHAVATVQQLMRQGASATIDVLGEEITSAEQSRAAVEQYHEVLAAIHQHGLDATVSIKPTHMGLKLDPGLCRRNIGEIVRAAAEVDCFVRIDMEDHSCTDVTLQLYRELRAQHDNVGTVIQAYLRRTMGDIRHLLDLSPNLRLCKGIYREPRRVAYLDPEIIRKSFAYSLETLLGSGCAVGIATHDERLVYHALTVVDRLGLSREDYEFQMLLGVEDPLRLSLLEQGHRVRVYVPFGRDWYAYSLRRLKENPAIVGHVMGQMWRRLFPPRGG